MFNRVFLSQLLEGSVQGHWPSIPLPFMQGVRLVMQANVCLRHGPLLDGAVRIEKFQNVRYMDFVMR